MVRAWKLVFGALILVGSCQDPTRPSVDDIGQQSYIGYWVDTIEYHANPDFLGLGNLPMDGCVENRLTQILFDAVYPTLLIHRSVGGIGCKDPANNRGFFTTGPVGYQSGAISYATLLDQSVQIVFSGKLGGGGNSIFGSAVFSDVTSSATVGALRSYRLEPSSVSREMLARLDQPFFKPVVHSARTLVLPTPP